MAIEFVGSQIATLGNSTASSYTIATTGLTGGSDTQAREGDLLIVASGWASVNNGNPGVLDTTLSWTEPLDLWGDDTYDTNLSVAWAHANVTPPATISVSASGATQDSSGAILFVFRGHDTTTPMDATPVGTQGANSNTPNPPAIVPATTGAATVAIGFGAFANGANRTITAAPTNYTGLRAMQSALGGTYDFMGGMAYRLSRTGGVSEDPVAFSVSGTANTSSWAAATLAIRPAPETSGGAGGADATGAASATGRAIAGADGSATASATASATGTAVTSANGAASGTGAADAGGAFINIASGDGQSSAAGDGSATATGIVSADGAATAAGAADGVLAATASGEAAASATGEADATGLVVMAAVGSASGTGAASGSIVNAGIILGGARITRAQLRALRLVREAVGEATASGAATGSGGYLSSSPGDVSGAGAAAGQSAVIIGAEGSASGAGQTEGVPAGTNPAVGAASGIGTAQAVSAAGEPEDEDAGSAGGGFAGYTPPRPAMAKRNAWLEIADAPDSVEAYAGVLQFPKVELPKPRKRALPKRKAKAKILEQRDGCEADGEWSLDQALIDNEMMLLLAA
jgi:hypothetical protein